MAYVPVEPQITVRGDDGIKILEIQEFIVDSSADLADLPECAPGSLAYTADLSYRAQYDGTSWHQIGGN